MSIDYETFKTAWNIPFNVEMRVGAVVLNSTKNPIPKEYIKTSYFNNLYDSNGEYIYWNPDKYITYNKGNRIAYKKVDLKQTVRTRIIIELITGKILTTTHDREVIVQ